MITAEGKIVKDYTLPGGCNIRISDAAYAGKSDDEQKRTENEVVRTAWKIVIHARSRGEKV